MAKNFKKKRLFTVAALTVLLALAMLVFAACETGKTYTLTFETGNGSAVSPIKAKAGDKIDLPDEPTLDGHRFDGWYLSEDFSGEKAALPETMPAENRTYYAKFTAIKTATLTLDAAGGVLETSVFELEAGEKVWRIVSQAVPSLTGAVFGGWFNGNSAVTENTVMPANGLTLTARYKASYVVEVYLEDLNGEYGAPTDQVTFEGGSDWLGREVRLGASVLKAPEGFLLDQTKTQPITLVAGENVYKAYFYRADGYPPGKQSRAARRIRSRRGGRRSRFGGRRIHSKQIIHGSVFRSLQFLFCNGAVLRQQIVIAYIHGVAEPACNQY